VHHNISQHEFITFILELIAIEKGKSLKKVKKLLFIKEDAKLNKRFWEILNDLLPSHPFVNAIMCPECGALEFIERASDDATANANQNNHQTNIAIEQQLVEFLQQTCR
jgi:hypothetical protein